jgi:hypothetical protein
MTQNIIKEGQRLKVRSDIVDLLGIIEASKKKIKLPIWVIGQQLIYEALEAEKDGHVLIMKRKVVETENGQRVVCNVYIATEYLSRA